jgi:hypothetical protein
MNYPFRLIQTESYTDNPICCRKLFGFIVSRKARLSPKRLGRYFKNSARSVSCKLSCFCKNHRPLANIRENAVLLNSDGLIPQNVIDRG